MRKVKAAFLGILAIAAISSSATNFEGSSVDRKWSADVPVLRLMPVHIRAFMIGCLMSGAALDTCVSNATSTFGK